MFLSEWAMHTIQDIVYMFLKQLEIIIIITIIVHKNISMIHIQNVRELVNQVRMKKVIVDLGKMNSEDFNSKITNAQNPPENV